ncbi:MAG: MBL fold metallo-hydrolase [Burkholderiales bacterium]|nr:MAG: MBL fold metallo-hydrolase [Burkholderiales bacterium]
MNPLEHELVYPWPGLPAPGEVSELRPGLLWVRMRLPFALDHINLWLLDDEIDGVRGWTIVDCGITSDETKAAWENIFDTVFAGRPLLRLIATHFHPDHLGLAHWLAAGGERRRWSAPLWMSATEWTIGRLLSQTKGELGDEAGERSAAHFARHGLADPESLAKVRARGAGYYSKLVPAVPPSYRRIQHGQSIAVGPHGARRVFEVIVGHGHAPEHVSLFCASDRLLISGDMVLPRISTNVSVFEVEPEGNPLPQYLHSLDRYLQLPEDTLVLPSHGKPFYGLHRRIAQQHAHHQARLEEVLAACAKPASAADILPVLFARELDLHQTTFALGESLAHLHALWFDGRVERRAGNDGVLRFVAV